MADFSIIGGSQRYENAGVDAASSSGVDVISSGTINTKGSWTELTASTGFDYNSLIMMAKNSNGAEVLLDIAVGAASSEEVIVENIPLNWDGSTEALCHPVKLPITIPAGTRISARVQSDISTTTIEVKCTGVSNVLSQSVGRGIATTYGADTATSQGTQVDPGATANTKGAYTELAASTTYDIKKLIVCIGTDRTSSISTTWLMDVSVGAAASEEVIVPDTLLLGDGSHDGVTPGFLEFDVSIPAGTRIALRGQCSSNSSSFLAPTLLPTCCA